MIDSILAAHFQLTVRCNLKCSFCGQSRGMAGLGTDEISVEQWLDFASQLRALSPEGKAPVITLWGGEPMLYGKFDLLAFELHKAGHPLHIVTNGTQIENSADTLCRLFDRIFISLDGMKDDHDAVRGSGVFDRVKENISLLKTRNGKLIFLCTVSDRHVDKAADIPLQMAELGCDEIVLQQLMYLSGREIEEYRRYSLLHFGRDYPELEAWRRDDDSVYRSKLENMLKVFEERSYPVKVVFTPHAYWFGENAKGCTKQLERIHIRHDGEVGFCTDYFGFSAGNALETPLAEILSSEKTRLFRKAAENCELPVCNHCPWRLQH